jgi:methyltransferase (TIGR00027 family)
MENSPIANVADTALWIAAYRAQETLRQDAAFKDTLAGKLAGERGFEMAERMPHAKAMAFAMVVRTAAIDRLVQTAIAKSVDTVINLGAGLDTRPYRMLLPAHLRWIEVDFPETIAYKNKLLAQEQPKCRLERLAADLSDENRRAQLFAQLGNEANMALIITEGVIGYLSNQQAASLSKALHTISSFRYWIQDYSQGRLRRNGHTRDLKKKLANAPIQFNISDPITFFGSHGWKPCENLHILDEADRIGRPMPTMLPWSFLMKLFPKQIRALGNKTYGYVLFCRD